MLVWSYITSFFSGFQTTKEDFYMKKEASRKFVDLIKRASSKWANWDPPNRIEAGDYGSINERSGAFTAKGNIYREESLKELAGKFPVRNLESLDKLCISSTNVKQLAFDAGVNVGLAGDAIASASFKSSWQFNAERGALLVMVKPRMTVVPGEFLEACKGISLLENAIVVTEVHDCPAFALYLSNKTNEIVQLALKSAAPIAAAAGSTLGVNFNTEWWNSGAAGVFSTAARDTASYTPLYQVRRFIKKGSGRRGGSSRVGPPEYTWVDVNTPWGSLDEDGNEADADSSDDD